MEALKIFEPHGLVEPHGTEFHCYVMVLGSYLGLDLSFYSIR